MLPIKIQPQDKVTVWESSLGEMSYHVQYVDGSDIHLLDCFGHKSRVTFSDIRDIEVPEPRIELVINDEFSHKYFIELFGEVVYPVAISYTKGRPDRLMLPNGKHVSFDSYRDQLSKYGNSVYELPHIEYNSSKGTYSGNARIRTYRTAGRRVSKFIKSCGTKKIPETV